MNKRVIQVPVVFGSVSRLADDSVKFSFTSTKEANSEEMGIYDSYRKSTGWMMYAENEFDIADIPQEKAPEREGKSQSKRLYNALFVLFVQKHPDANPAEFDVWYRNQMEHIITKVKEQLND